MKTASSQTANFDRAFSKSRDLADRARRSLAGGATHDSWGFSPFPVAFQRAHGSQKWDLDGRSFVDYWMGHGALLCGHAFKPVIKAVEHQLSRGTHFGGTHELQIQWAEKIQDLVPSAERVRFTSSGTEAVMLAVRVARAYTGRNIVVRLDGHFHGWHDESLAPFFPGKLAGINHVIGDSIGLASADDIESVECLLADQNVAAVLLEPGGGSSGSLPFDAVFLRSLRQLADKHGTLLIFDEVISGFRYAPGGVQSLCNVKPDLTTLAKIMSGGLPGGAICGARHIMSCFGTGIELQGQYVRVPHTGTFNGNPLSAAAGLAMLESIEDGRSQQIATEQASTLVDRLNDLCGHMEIDVAFFHQSSIFHILIGPRQLGSPLTASAGVMKLYRERPDRYEVLRRELLCAGVDCHPTHGWVSTRHDSIAIEATVNAFVSAFKGLALYDPSLEL